MGYIVDQEKWLKIEVSQIRALTFAIDAATDETRIPKHLQEITKISQRAQRMFRDTVVNPHRLGSH